MINYRIVGRKNPADRDSVKKYYACLVNPGVVDIEGLAKRISANCTVTRADCLAVLSALQEQIVYALQSGMRVHMGDVGSFRLSCQCGGAETPEDFDVSYIKKLRVVYNPSKALKEAIELGNGEVQFYNLDGRDTSAGSETEEEEPIA